MITKENSNRIILTDDELQEVSGGAIVMTIHCGLTKEKNECEKKGCVWIEPGECRNK